MRKHNLTNIYVKEKERPPNQKIKPYYCTGQPCKRTKSDGEYAVLLESSIVGEDDKISADITDEPINIKHITYLNNCMHSTNVFIALLSQLSKTIRIDLSEAQGGRNLFHPVTLPPVHAWTPVEL